MIPPKNSPTFLRYNALRTLFSSRSQPSISEEARTPVPVSQLLDPSTNSVLLGTCHGVSACRAGTYLILGSGMFMRRLHYFLPYPYPSSLVYQDWLFLAFTPFLLLPRVTLCQGYAVLLLLTIFSSHSWWALKASTEPLSDLSSSSFSLPDLEHSHTQSQW